MKVLEALLGPTPEPKPFDSLAAWWSGFSPILASAEHPIDAAILGGFGVDRLAPVFAAGYQAALRALVPGLPADRIASLCATEQGGGHPRAIRTTITPEGPGSFTITGDKRWATLSSEAGLLLVVGRTGDDPEKGHPLLRVARVDAGARGVSFVPMHATPFVPEIPHAEVSLAGVRVSEADLLPGDGYDDYLKPFRTIEDLHVDAAIAAYLLFLARRHRFSHLLVERLVAELVTLRTLAMENPSLPVVHVALAGALATLEGLCAEMDGPLAAAAPEEHARLVRDRPLFAIASHARAERTKRAWERLGG